MKERNERKSHDVLQMRVSSYLCLADDISYRMCEVNGNFVTGLNSNSTESYFVNCEL